MDYSRELLERAYLKVRSYNQISKVADTSRQHIGKVKAEQCNLGPYSARLIAEFLGEDGDQAEKLALAESAKSREEENYWKKLAGIAASVIVSLSIFGVSPDISAGYKGSVVDTAIHY